MKLSKEILAYALQNAIEFGKTDASRILPKLFQHGLKKEEIKKVLPMIKEIVNEVNSMGNKERRERFTELTEVVVKKEEKEKSLPELSNVPKKPVFRMAPFPSGALHIGNAKTYILNALYAEKYDGDILLVMDDTIGSSEKQPIKEAYKLIEESLKFLGIEYKKPIVYKSDRLEIYYGYAEELIKKDKAYVCYCTQSEIRDNREKGVECSCRKSSVKKQMEGWKKMFEAKEGHATLRIKTDMTHKNPAFRDRVLFKISDRKHPRVGKKYRVWPSLEMSWAIDDNLLKITHIIRGNDLTMETEMERYIWDIFGWKHPDVTHTGLIRIEGLGAKISKSKAQKEVMSGKFKGWDDPRTWSIQSLEKRGIRKEAIREFVESIGLNKQDITVPIETLYAMNRRILDKEADRYSFVADPVKVEVAGADIKEISVHVHPDKEEKRKIKIGGKIFVSGEDYKKFKDKEIRLLHLFNVVLKKKTKVSSNEVKKEMQKINWVSDSVEARVLMPDGEWVEGKADAGIKKLKKGEVLQFERFGFVKYQGKEDRFEFWFGHP